MTSTLRRALFAAGALTAALFGCGPGRDPAAPGSCEITFTDRGEVRLFVVGHHMRLDDAVSYESYQASYRRHLEQIRPCLSDARPNLLVFPEDAGLVAWFIGRQGMLARGSGDSGTAFNALYAQHYRASDAYRTRFPGISAARALTLAAADPAWRAIERTFGGMARELGAWVITSGNLPESKRSDLARDAVFGDPDARDGAYVAIGPELYNSAFLYSPDGERAGRIDKVYLTDPEEEVLDLSSGSLERMGTFDLPFGRVGAAISRDAFYSPFLQRMEDEGVELVVQPEAFRGWTIEEHPGDWLPEVILNSGYMHTQKYRGFRNSAAPMLTGNLFDFVFDGQTWITEKAEPGSRRLGFVGTEPLAGFQRMGPWAFDDPGAGLPLSERRAQLRARGKELLPGSGSKSEGRYIDSVIAADLALYGEGGSPPPKPVTPGAGAPSYPIAAAVSGHQTNPDAAYDDADVLYAVWSDSRSGTPRVYLASSPDDGVSWTGARAVDAPGGERQLRPTIAAGVAGRLVIAWQERRDGVEQIRLASSVNGGAIFLLSWVDAAPGAQWEPDLAIGPGGEAALAWADFREGPAPKVRVACGDDSGGWGASSVIDPSTAELPRAQGSQLQPSVAFGASGRVAVAWVDYRGRDWQVFASAASRCSALGPGEQVGEESGSEVLSSDPQLARAPAGGLVLAWDDLRERRGHHDVRAAVLPAAGSQWQRTPLLQGGADSGAFVSRFRPSVAWVGSTCCTVLFQDLAAGKNALGTTTVGAGGADAVARFDDTGSSANQLTRPRVVARKGNSRGAVLFEDDREGFSRVRCSVVAP
ncbi:MAG: nitrilase-related carbon-nitrogen hydrolase [Myxococcaceae bacterium]